MEGRRTGLTEQQLRNLPPITYDGREAQVFDFNRQGDGSAYSVALKALGSAPTRVVRGSLPHDFRGCRGPQGPPRTRHRPRHNNYAKTLRTQSAASLDTSCSGWHTRIIRRSDIEARGGAENGERFERMLQETLGIVVSPHALDALCNLASSGRREIG